MVVSPQPWFILTGRNHAASLGLIIVIRPQPEFPHLFGVSLNVRKRSSISSTATIARTRRRTRPTFGRGAGVGGGGRRLAHGVLLWVMGNSFGVSIHDHPTAAAMLPGSSKSAPITLWFSLRRMPSQRLSSGIEIANGRRA